MMRFCPACETERDVIEVFCEGEIGGTPCGWDLSGLPIRQPGWRPAPAVVAAADQPAPALLCPNGHPAEPGDLLCSVCDAEIGAAPLGGDAADAPFADGAVAATVVAGWRLEQRLPSTSQVRERYTAVHEADGREALLTLYADGSEPDPEVYDVLRAMPRDHVPEIIETGRWHERAYEVSEDLRGGTLADLGLLPDDVATLSQILVEVGGALAAFAECGLRHRDLRPGAIMVRAREPLDLVITGFGSARLSDFDLDVVSPLETTRYMAPEAVAGGVAAASDWWSLGMLLLEQVTRGACFAGADDQSFLISVLTNGAPIPEGLVPQVDLLLRGLLARDRRERWGWSETQRWLAGDMPLAPDSSAPAGAAESRRTIALGGKRYGSAQRFALAAAEADAWEEAAALLLRGEVATWLEDAGLDAGLRDVRAMAALGDVSDDIRLALALKALNPAMPLVVRGEIVTPGWLLDHPAQGYALISGPVPALLEARDTELWLSRLQRRESRVRERARQLDVTLDEEALRVNLLSTSRSRLAAVWEEKRRILPDTDHPGLLALLERRITQDEELILLLSADIGQFRAADVILAEAGEAARRAGVAEFDADAANAWLQRPRRELYAAIEARTEGFARCGHDRIDEWADQFRLERRLAISRALALLGVPADQWRAPPKQSYVATLLDFYARRITGSVMRGALTRMVIGKTTARLDLSELDSPRQRAAAMLDHLLLRNGQPIEIDPAPLVEDPRVERRLRTLYSHATLYRRDTGIDGLYLGFPFLVMQETKASVRPRIAPILLWPIKLKPEVGARGRVEVAFDSGREEVRLNPAFETLLGVDAAKRWSDAAREMLGRASVTAAEVIDAFRALAEAENDALVPLPGKDACVQVGDDRVVGAAVLFHLAYLGQAVMEDLRQLKAIPPGGSSLETALRVGEEVHRAEVPEVREAERYFTAASDPSQEAAVLEARTGRGLLVEGPPGTGKSQTIVNMVADAIGTGRSLLIVCQKQAALEVVYKRLEAEGLGDRIVMVNDVNKDREPVIRAIREQLDTLWSRPSGASAWRQQRQQTAARIELLETALDSHHAALHATDEQTGLSYRLILGDLIGLADQGTPIPSLPALRHLLGQFDPGGLAVLQETCAPLARLWLPAHYEGSPLAATRAFAADAGTLAGFTADLEGFAEAERARAEVTERTPDALAIDDPQPYRDWADGHGATLKVLSQERRDRLARWLGLFATREAPEAPTSLQAELADVERGMLALPADDASEDALDVALALDDEALADWTEIANVLAAKPGFFQLLSPIRWLRHWRRARFLKASGLGDAEAFRSALHRETRVRPWRERLAAALVDAGEPVGRLAPLRSDALLARTRGLRAELDAVEGLVRGILAYPTPPTALAMARAATRQAVDDLLEGVDQGIARHAARSASTAALALLNPWFEADWLEACRLTIAANEDNANRVAPIVAALPTLGAYQRFRVRVPQLDGAELEIFALLGRLRETLETLGDDALEPMVRRILANEARLAWKTRLESEQPALLLEAAELEAKATSLATADREMRGLNRRLLVDGLDARGLRPLREWEDITRLRGVRARRLREFIDRGADLGLMALRPVWLVNPDVASRLLPLKKAMFDTVVYDEASQMPIEYALPTLFRSRTMIVSGDEKQMPPSSFFAARIESDEAEAFEGDDGDEDAGEEEREAIAETWNRREIKDCPDLLQLAKTVLPSTTLQIHYRSIYRELIQFSNASFYVNRLSVPARHPEEEIRRVRPIEVIRADGVYEAQTNAIEAEHVVDVVAGLWKDAAGHRPTLGVVTFNRKQADLIDDLLEERAEHDPALRQALAQERDRIEGGEDMGFFVKNVENVQGDERDIIVFSSTFGRNAQGSFRRNFGVLGQVGGERRLNVAVTRARTKIILVTSLPIALISDLLSTRRQAATPRDYLQAYFEYARAISAGELDTARALLGRLSPEQRRQTVGNGDLDGFQASVAEEIRRIGWTPAEAGDEGAFGLDFAIEDPRTGLYGIGIECDAPRHPLLAAGRAREMWRPMVLGRSIPMLHRVSSHRWFHEPERERLRLRDAIERAMGAAA